MSTNSRSDKILFWASFFTLIAAGIGFAIRGAILGDWARQFGFTKSELGAITGGGLTGFCLGIFVFSFLADKLGYAKIMIFAFAFHVLSAVVTLAATPMFDGGKNKDAAYQCLYWGSFIFAMANGTCEAVINPLVASLFPKNKTHYLNILHAGWPGGLILGALLGLIFDQIGGIPWEAQISIFLVPTLLYGVLMLGKVFPRSEASKSGVKLSEMMGVVGMVGSAVVAILVGLWLGDVLPKVSKDIPAGVGWLIAFLLWLAFGSASKFAIGSGVLAFLFVIHAMVGSVELGTDSWISNITGAMMESKTKGLLLFVWTSGMMFALRFFAGPIVHKISPLGLLLASAILGALGLYMIGSSEGAMMCVVAATIYGIGKTFFWPTMLGVVSEQFPRGGALAMGIVGGVGMLSAGVIGGPIIGYKQDYYASEKLVELSKESKTYDRYMATDKDDKEAKKAFLFFPEVSALDGAKVGILMGDPGKDNGNGKSLDADLVTVGNKINEEKYKSLRDQRDWWEKTGKPNASTDQGPVGKAVDYGGRHSLMFMALFPVTMAVCYLLLIFYYVATGGYKQVHIDDPHGGMSEAATPQ